MNSSEIRNIAWSMLSGQWTNAVLAALLMIGVSIVAGVILGDVPVIGSVLVQFLVTIPLGFGLTLAFYEFALNRDSSVLISNIFSNITVDYKRAVLLPILVSFFTFLWGLLLFVPGIVKSYSYAMSYYISKENPGLTYNQCIDLSIRMMEGHKMELFRLDLSFIGWYLLCIVTFGIAAI